MAYTVPIMMGVGAAAGAASSFMSARNQAIGFDAERQQNMYNATQSRYAAEQAYQESSLNASMTALQGRRDIASGAAAMSAAGNIGTSAQTAVREGAFNLDKDLAALRWKYTNEATQHKNQAKIYDYNASIARRNRNNAVISSFLSPVASLGNSVVTAYGMGLIK